MQGVVHGGGPPQKGHLAMLKAMLNALNGLSPCRFRESKGTAAKSFRSERAKVRELKPLSMGPKRK